MRFLCIDCGKDITDGDIAVHKKLVNRGAESDFYCRDCICKKYGFTKEKLTEMIKLWQRQGCALFPEAD